MTSFSRRSALGLAGAGLAAACAPSGGPAASADRALRDEVEALTAAITPSMPYRAPRGAEVDQLVGALLDAIGAGTASGVAGDARRTLEQYGITVHSALDGADRRHTVAVASASGSRSWGLFAAPLDTAPRLLVEVPHPVADRHTEKVALDLVAEAPGAVLVQAGAHRRAGDGRADVAHETSSLFHAVVARIAANARLPQIQVHGFDDANHDPDVDVVLSPGAAAVTPLLEAAGTNLAEAGHAVCRAWSEDDCPDLAGRTNVQGRHAARVGLPFLHVELGESLREGAEQRAAVARALARALDG